jgi:preprotein translocase subunit SecB
MEKQDKLESGFQIKNMILLESIFTRVGNVSFSDSINNDVKIDVGVNVKDKMIIVEETVTVTQEFQKNEQVKFKVKMVGIFELIGNTAIPDLKEFGEVNGAAIIFPYIREHITALSLKGGIGAILLKPVNFTKKVDKIKR